MKRILSLSILFFSSFAFAGWAQDFEAIKDVPRNYQDAGAICEEIGKVQFERQYGDRYEVVVGIEYGDNDKTIGELDLVVIERSTSQVKYVAEVKCWKSMAGGLRKAKDQRQRFLTNLKSGKHLYFSSTSTGEDYDIEQFQSIQSFTTMGQKGARAAGYDHELEYDLRQLHEYSDKMIHCQNRGECAQPE